MCKVGDIILVEKYKHGEKTLSRHSFIVLSVDEDKIEGLEYHMVCNVMSSFRDEEQRKKKLDYPGNFEVTPEDVDVPGGNQKTGYIKAEQLYFFNKDNLDYRVIGSTSVEFFIELIEFIENLDTELVHVIDNLKK